MKHLMLSESVTDEEIETVEKQYADHFYRESYRVCCQNSQKRELFSEENYILLDGIGESDIFIVPEEKLDLLLKNELQGGYVGISKCHQGIRELREAYLESLQMRKTAFLRSRTGMYADIPIEHIPEGLIAEAAKLTEASARLQRVQLLGTEHTEELLEFVMRLHESINSRFDVNKNSQKMQMAVEYIKKNYASDLNMAVVSNHISMNYSLFSYSFKQYTGSNFVNFLKDIRMREAKKLLAETDMKIIEISQMVGYDNEKHFMKIFKATCGVSPSEYRKNMNRA